VANKSTGDIASKPKKPIRKRSGRDFFKNEESLKRLVELAAEGILIADPKTKKFLYANRAICRMLGYPKRELLALSVFDIHPRDSLKPVLSESRKRAGEKKVLATDRPCLRKDGIIIYADIVTSSMDIDGIDCNVGFFTDVTAEKRAKEALKENEERFRQVAENAGVWIWEVDKQGLYTYSSPTVKKIMGYQPEEIVGKKHFYDLFHPDHREKMKKEAFSVFAGKKAFRDFINKNVHKNGTSVWLSTSGVPFLDEQGNHRGYRGTDTDITRMRKAEEALRESEVKFRTLVDQAPQALFLHDLRGRIKDVNSIAVKRYGYSRNEMLKLLAKDIDPDFSERENSGKFWKKLETQKKLFFETRHRKKDGSIFPVRISLSLVTIKDRDHIIALADDITKIKNAEKKKLENEKRFRQLFDNMTNGVAVYSPVENGNDFVFRDLNRAGEKLSRIKKRDVIGKKISDVFPGVFALGLMDALRETYKTGKVTRVPLKMYQDNRIQHWVENTVHKLPSGEMTAIYEDVSKRERANQALRDSEEKFRTLFETMAQGVVCQDRSGKIISANPAAEQILGRTLEQMTGIESRDSDWKAVHQDGSDIPGETHPSRTALETGKAVTNTVMGVFNPVDQQYRWINVNAVPQFKEGEKKPFQVYITFEDISQLKRMIDELKTSEERLRILFEFAPDGYYLNDMAGNFLDGNRQAEKLIGRKRGELIGMNMLEIFDLNEEDKKKAQAALEKNAAGLPSERDEFTLKRPDGSRVVLEISAHPVKIGRNPLVLGIARDITRASKLRKELEKYRIYLEDLVKERTQKLEQALSDSENNRDRIDTILKSVSDGLIVTDINHHIVLMNQVAEDFLAIRFSDIQHSTIDSAFNLSELTQMIKTALSHHTVVHQSDIEVSVNQKKGKLILEITAKSIFDRENNPIGVLTTLRDATRERKIDRMKTEFLGTAAHELRTPLTTLQGFSEILMTRRDLKETDREKFLGYINRQAVNLANIVSDLLDISRLEAGKGFLLKRGPCSPNAIISRLVDYFRVSQPGHTFVTRLEKSNLPIHADCEKMEQVLVNLISNAVNYSPRGGKITLTSAINSSRYQLTVADPGIGMTRAQAGRMFERFYRADNSDSAPPGSGLGMHIVKQIIDRHRGRIRVESQPGKGTRVQVLLPVGLRDIDRDSPKTGQNRRNPGSKKK